MNKLIFGSSFILSMHFAIAQTVGIGTTTPRPSAQLEIKSTNKGVLLPRLDTAQINKIVQPDSGLMVYCTTYKQLAFWDGTYWMIGDGSSMNPLKLGDFFGGGTVFYIDGSGKHGLTAYQNGFESFYPNNLNAYYSGQHYGITFSSYFNSGIGSGKNNTAAIVNFGINDPFYPDLKTLLNYSIEGLSDWYLPSRIEIDLMVKAFKEGIFIEAMSYGSKFWSSEPNTIAGINAGATTYWVRCRNTAANPCDAWLSTPWNQYDIYMILIRQF